jgi:hypothetical protein
LGLAEIAEQSTTMTTGKKLEPIATKHDKARISNWNNFKADA